MQTDLCESEALFLNLAYLKLEFLRLGFTFSKPSLRDSRSMWYVESDHIRRQKPRIEPLRLELLIIYILSKPNLLAK